MGPHDNSPLWCSSRLVASGLEKQELQKALENTGIDKDEISSLFKAHDEDGDNTIDVPRPAAKPGSPRAISRRCPFSLLPSVAACSFPCRWMLRSLISALGVAAGPRVFEDDGRDRCLPRMRRFDFRTRPKHQRSKLTQHIMGGCIGRTIHKPR